jgi:ankyrin repeat protein
MKINRLFFIALFIIGFFRSYSMDSKRALNGGAYLYRQSLTALMDQLIDMARKGYLEGIKKTILKPCYKNCKKNLVNTKDNKGKTLLQIALYNKHFALAECLIENGAHVDAYDKFRWSLLYQCLVDLDDQGAIFLVDHGANVNLCNVDGYSPLYIALLNNNMKLITYLIDHKANVHLQNYAGKTVLHLAAKQATLELVELLIKQNAKINIQDGMGSTPLHYAAKCGNASVVKLLLNHGADHTMQDKRHKTPLDRALFEPETYGVVSSEVVTKLKLLYKHRELVHEVQTNPTQETLKGAIKSDFILLIHLLICNSGIKPTEKHLKLAKKNKSFEAGRLLICYFGITKSQSCISKTGISSAFMLYVPQEIVELIAQYVLLQYDSAS